MEKKSMKRTAAFAAAAVTAGILALTGCLPVLATSPDGGTVVKSGIENLLGIVSAIISSIGEILVLVGLGEYGISLQTHDGSSQASAFKRIAGGLIMVIAPQLLPILLPS